jgi:hypothetical protein
MRSTNSTLCLFGLTIAAVLVHGYHPGAEDAEIYLSAVKKDLNPALYPHNAQFFMTHARLTLFDELIAGSVRLTHIPLEAALLLWHVFSIFLLLWGCLRLARLCFHDVRAQWAGVAFVSALLTLPVAGTALYLMDQYVNPRSLSTPALLLAVVSLLESRFARAGLWLAFAALIHPQMALFGVCFIGILVWMKRRDAAPAVACLILPFGLSFGAPSEAYRATLQWKSYFFLRNWEWYEWLGIVGPVLVLYWIARIARRHKSPALELVSRSLIAFELAFFVGALAIEPLPGLAKLQPMRALHIVYLLMVLFIGGILGQFVLKNRIWRWGAVLAPLCAVMGFAQLQLFPNSEHVEWPGYASKSEWLQAFAWIRDNTPQNAFFALDPDYVELPDENWQGFRANAERSSLASDIADSGAASVFPALAEIWLEQSRDQRSWKQFTSSDFQRLQQKYGVNWFALQKTVDGLDCPYHNAAAWVCRID